MKKAYYIFNMDHSIMQKPSLLFSWMNILCVLVCFLQAKAHGEGLPSVFNGNDFSGWRVPENNIWWSIENGVLKAVNDSKRTGSILWTEQTFVNFVIELEFKFGEGKVDTGIFLRSETDQIQLGLSGSMKRDMTASPYIAGKGYPVEAKGVQRILKLKDWNLLTCIAKGSTYSVWLNNRHVMTYESETASLKGPIGLQLHADRIMTAYFRNLRCAELD